MKRVTVLEKQLRERGIKEEFIKRHIDFVRSLRGAARREGISLCGHSNDISGWNGYSYDPYRYVAIKVEDGLVSDIWEGSESGNFLPQNCCYVVMTKSTSAEDVIESLWNQF